MLGCGLGLRPAYYDDLLANRYNIDFLEIISEDFMVEGGAALQTLDRLCQLYPIIMHGVSLSIGSVDPLNIDHLMRLKKLEQRVKPALISDHFCWTGVGNINTHDLLPMPFTFEAVEHIVSRIHYVQEYLQRELVLENISSYIGSENPELCEWDFINEIVSRSGCKILLDINNIYINAYNYNFDAKKYIDAISANDVVQYHLAGHKHCGTHIIDTHDAEIIDPVWDLFNYAVEKIGPRVSIIERDDELPELIVLLNEMENARNIMEATKCL